MVKTHEVLMLLGAGIEEVIDVDNIIMVHSSISDGKLELTLTEKDLTESKYRVSVEMIDDKKETGHEVYKELLFSDADIEIIKKHKDSNLHSLYEDLRDNSTSEKVRKVCKRLCNRVVPKDVILNRLPEYERRRVIEILGELTRLIEKYTNLPVV